MLTHRQFVKHPLPFSAGSSARSSQIRFSSLSTTTHLGDSLSSRFGYQDPMDQDTEPEPA
jgi:hypothetical protein